MGNSSKKPLKDDIKAESVEKQEQVNPVEIQDMSNLLDDQRKYRKEIQEAKIIQEQSVKDQAEPPSFELHEKPREKVALAELENIEIKVEDTFDRNISLPQATQSIAKRNDTIKTKERDTSYLPVFHTSVQEIAQNNKSPFGEDVEIQYHSTKIFDHNIEVDGIKLSEIREVASITVIEAYHERFLGTIMLHSRTIGNRKLEIITHNSDSNEIIDHKIRTFVTMIVNSTCVTRAMSTPELRKFKLDWNKLWKPKFTDTQLKEYVQLNFKEENSTAEEFYYQSISKPYPYARAKFLEWQSLPGEQEPEECKMGDVMIKDELEAENNIVQDAEIRAKNLKQGPSGWETYTEPTPLQAIRQADRNESKIKTDNMIINSNVQSTTASKINNINKSKLRGRVNF